MTQITNDMKTDWFPASVKPVRAGLYETERFQVTDAAAGIRLARWDGFNWRYVESTGLMPAGGRMEMCTRDGDRWRGLTEEAHARLAESTK